MGNKLIEKAASMSQEKLEKQYQAANFSDQRAMNFAGVQIAVAAILCGLAGSSPAPIAMLIGSGALLAAAFFAWWSVMPSTFHVIGAKFSDFQADIENNVSLDAIFSEIGKYSDMHIDKNEAARRNCSWHFRWSFLISMWSLGLTLLVQFIAQINV